MGKYLEKWLDEKQIGYDNTSRAKISWLYLWYIDGYIDLAVFMYQNTDPLRSYFIDMELYKTELSATDCGPMWGEGNKSSHPSKLYNCIKIVRIVEVLQYYII